MSITPVILCGGSGTRLWPVSTPELPKQFHALTGEGTLLQETVRRAASLGLGRPVVVCSAADLETVRRQIADVGIEPRLVITEPQGRNTAAAVAAAALMVDGRLLVMPADHVISDTSALAGAVASGEEAAAAGMLVVFGVVADRPETGYGYIRPGASGDAWKPVVAFTEKPDLEAARSLVAAGCLWNSGMFLFDSATVRDELRRWAPEVIEAVSGSIPSEHGPVARLTDAFAASPSIAFDRAVMEKTERAAVVPLEAGWSDIGSWAALWEFLPKDGHGNVSLGDVRLVSVERSYVRASRRVVVLGLSDVVVVDTGDTVLVAARDEAQTVGELSDT